MKASLLNNPWRYPALMLVIVLLAACSGRGSQVTQEAGTGGAAATAVATGTASAPATAGAPAETASATEAGTGGSGGAGGQGQATLPAPAAAAGFNAPASEDCQQMAANVQAILGVEKDAVTVDEKAEFQDPASKATGTGCKITITGTGADFGDVTFADVTDAFNVVFQSMGFSADAAQAVESTNNTQFVMHRGNELALVNIQAQPGAAATCPQGKSVTDCGLEPSQIDFTISVTYSRKG